MAQVTSDERWRGLLPVVCKVPQVLWVSEAISAAVLSDYHLLPVRSTVTLFAGQLPRTFYSSCRPGRHRRQRLLRPDPADLA